MFTRFILVTFFSFVLITDSVKAQALSNRDLTEKMAPGEAASYIGATVSAMAFMSYMNGRQEQYRCILDWYYNSEDTPAFVDKALARFPDKTPQETLFVLIKKRCGDIRTSD